MNLWERILTLIYPERCVFCDSVVGAGDGFVCARCRREVKTAGGGVCLKCGRAFPEGDEYTVSRERCPDCERRMHSFDRGRSLYVYDRRVAKSIYRLKYGGRRRYALYYGRKLAECFGDQLTAWGASALVPVPIHPERLRKRGYNQAELIAGELSRITGVPMRTDLVARVKNTRPQKLLGAAQRDRNLKSAFKLCQFDVKLDSVVLVDDIYTTGSTVDEISALLKEAGAGRVYFLAAASGSAPG